MSIDDTTQLLPTGAPVAAIPEALRRRDQWVLWRLDAKEDGELTKVPYSDLGRKAQANKPSSWLSFDVALQRWAANPHGWVGIGAGVYAAFYRYKDALDDLINTGENTDLDGSYSRFAEKALRIAIVTVATLPLESSPPALEEGPPAEDPLFSGIPRSKRTILRLYLRGNQESDQERARELCDTYGIDYTAAREATR
jgi:hypothetical protein